MAERLKIEFLPSDLLNPNRLIDICNSFTEKHFDNFVSVQGLMNSQQIEEQMRLQGEFLLLTESLSSVFPFFGRRLEDQKEKGIEGVMDNFLVMTEFLRQVNALASDLHS